MDWLDRKYAFMLSAQLERFKQVKNNLNFRCPICGDSHKSKSKARGWLLGETTKTRFYCHNCSASMSFASFLKTQNQYLFSEYLKEKYLEDAPRTLDEPEPEKKKIVVTSNPLNKLKKISQLDPSHKAKRYVDSRMIPSKMHYKLFYCPKFKKWVNSIIPNKFESIDHDDDRLIIPFFNKDGTLIGFQGRSFKEDSAAKYITIMLDNNQPKICGLDEVNPNKEVWMVEGPIDSYFIDNAIASAGGRLDSNLELTNVSKDNIIIVYDNEPRNREVVAHIESAINNGMKVVIWPEYINQKDINNMVLDGMSPSYIVSVMKQRTFKGLDATIELTKWKRN